MTDFAAISHSSCALSVRKTVSFKRFDGDSGLKRLLKLCGSFLAAFGGGGSAAFAQIPQDPEGSGVIIGAVNWLQGTLLGTFATVAAVIAVASVGFMMLTGRINWRHGAVVILGCFILFGAASIVSGIRASAGG
jgi:type IV secretory pathway VirB2 component (pilin)